MLYTKQLRNDVYAKIITMSTERQLSISDRVRLLRANGFTVSYRRHSGVRTGSTQIVGGRTKRRGLGAMMPREIRIAISAPRGRYSWCVVFG